MLTFFFLYFSFLAIGEYEELRAENKKTKEECDKIKQERDEAVKKTGGVSEDFSHGY